MHSVSSDGEIDEKALHRREIRAHQARVVAGKAPGLDSVGRAIADRFYAERVWRQRTQKLGLGACQINPVRPVGRPQHHDLAVVVGRYVRAGLSREHRERWWPVRLGLVPDPCDRIGDR
jgi:hypothetical protein